MEDDDSSSSLNPSTAFTLSEKVQRGVVTTTTEDEGDETSSQSNSNNEVLVVRPEPVSSANTTTDSLTGTGDPDVGCSPTSTGLNSTTEDADVEDNSSPRSGERITTSSSSSSDGYNFDERPHSQRDEKNSSHDSSERKWLTGTGPRQNHTNPPGPSFKYARSSTVFSPFAKSGSSEVSVGNRYSSSSSQVSFSSVTPNPFALTRSPPGGPISHNPNSSSLYHDTLATSRSLGGPARNAAPFASESKPILRPSSLLAASCLAPSASAITSSLFSAVRNPFGSTTSSNNSNSSVSSSSYFNNPFYSGSASAFGSKQDELVSGNGKGTGKLFGGASNSSVPEDVASTTSSSFVESSISVKPAGSTSILRQSKLSNVHYPCTSSDNSEARYSGGNVDSTQGEILSLRQQPSTSTTISSEAAAKLSTSNNLGSAGVGTTDNTPPTPPSLFQSISSSAGHAFSQPLPPQPVATTSENNTMDFVFGSNISDRVVGASTNSGRSPESSATLPNGVSSTSSSVASTFDGSGSTQSAESELASAGGSMVHSSTEDDQFQGNALGLGQPTEACFASSSTIGERKRKFSDQVVTTGEENESNVLSTSCRLFVFDGPTSTWIERGRGQLRLNDKIEAGSGSNRDSRNNASSNYDEEDELMEPMQSRIIVRTKGSLRLMLNTHVWSGMKVEKPSDKSVRFTANDNGTIKIFVVQSSPNDADVLFSALDCRVQSLMSYESSNPSGFSYLPPTQGEVSHQSSSLYPHSGTTTPPTSAFGASTIVENRRVEIDSSEFDDSDEEDTAEKSEDDDSPHKKKRLENEATSETPSPSTTTNECVGEAGMGSVLPQGLRSNVVPSIQVDKPETRSDDDDDEDG